MRNTPGPRRNHHRVIFRHRRKIKAVAAHQQPSSTMNVFPAESITKPMVPDLFTSGPPIRDALLTETSELQDQTVEECLSFLKGDEDASRNAYGIPGLYRDRHVRFLQKQLDILPAVFKSADPSRPWIFYWCLAGLSLLGHDVDSYRSRLVETVRPMQNKTGGFGGGFGQTSHLATTYATVLSLAIVGGNEAYELIDRRSMWRWLCSLKQPDGGFQMAVGGEEDVRGAYCAAVVISLLNIPLSLSPDSPACEAGHTELFSGLGAWMQRCQTYEGGVSAKPGVEAHGAYAFCALGCLSILDSPHRTVPRYLDVPRLLSWLSARQYAPEGGFSGRTNKLVDGCYSHWVGGCWPLVEAGLKGSRPPAPEPAYQSSVQPDDCLFNRNGLIRYILCCGQDLTTRGGLRDKPSKYSDAYHTCYVLSGLSSAQNQWQLSQCRSHEAMIDGDAWTASIYSRGEQIFDEQDRVCPTHPVYAIPPQKVDDCQRFFILKQGF